MTLASIHPIEISTKIQASPRQQVNRLNKTHLYGHCGL